MQLAIFAVVTVFVASSTISGRHLLVAGLIWLLAVCAWVLLPSSDGFWGVKFSRRHRAAAIALVYFCLLTYEFLLFGWMIPVGIGIYKGVLQ